VTSNARPRIAAPIAAVVLFFAVSRLLFAPLSLGSSTFSLRGNLLQRASDAASGRLFNSRSLGDGMPLLDRELLLHDLGRSLWYLHAQPPLFNLFVAGMLRLPGDFARNYQWLAWGMGLARYLLTFALMRRLGVPPWIAAAAVIVFMLMPNAMWLENAVYYGLPLGLMLLAATLAYDRAMRSGSVAALAAAALLLAAMVLTRAFFTWLWCALLLAFFAVTFTRAHGRRARAAAAVALPLLLVIAFQAKQYAVFRQTLGSSWFGCNLFSMTAGMRPEKARALAAGKVSNLVNVYRNAEPEVYLRYADLPPTGIPALDQLKKSTGQPNFNHRVYIPIGRIYLHDSLYLIAHAPHKYAANVLNSLYIFGGYQSGIVFDHPRNFFARWSWRELAAPLVGWTLMTIALVHGWRRMRRDDANRFLIAVMLFNVAYVILVSCLFEKSEGPVYRQQIEPFLWVLLASAAASRLAGRRDASGDVRD
jgi:hypothetical protein